MMGGCGACLGRNTQLLNRTNFTKVAARPEIGEVTALGIDDFARRRGQLCGSALVVADAGLSRLGECQSACSLHRTWRAVFRVTAVGGWMGDPGWMAFRYRRERRRARQQTLGNVCYLTGMSPLPECARRCRQAA